MVENSMPDAQDDPIAPTKKGLVSRRLLWSFILVFSALSIAAVVVAFQGKDPIAERQAAEEEKRRQQQVSQASGNPAELGKIVAEQARAGRAAKEAASRPSDAALAVLTGTTPDTGTSPLDANVLPSSEQVEAYRQRRDAVMAVNLPIYLDEREPRRSEGAGLREVGRNDSAMPPPEALATSPRERLSDTEPRGLDELAQRYGALPAAGGQAARLAGGPANEEWLRRVQQSRTDDGPVFAQPALFPQHTLRRGSIIPAVTVRGLTSDLPGQLTVQVTQDIYDTATGANLLIPKGTLVVGPFNTSVSENQARLFVAFQQLIYRDGATVNLPGMPGSDLAGYSGLPGEKESHFWRIFGGSFLIAGLAKLLEPKAQSNNTVVINSGAALSDAAGQVLLDTTRRILDRNQEIRPTVTFGHGEKLNIEVTRDLVLPPEITGIGSRGN